MIIIRPVRLVTDLRCLPVEETRRCSNHKTSARTIASVEAGRDGLIDFLIQRRHCFLKVARILDDSTISQHDHASRIPSDRWIVGHQDNRQALFLVKFSEHGNDFAACFGIQVACWFVTIRIDGFVASARAIATRCCWPPES